MARVKPLNLMTPRVGSSVNHITIEKLKAEYPKGIEEETMHGRNAVLWIEKVCHKEID